MMLRRYHKQPEVEVKDHPSVLAAAEAEIKRLLAGKAKDAQVEEPAAKKTKQKVSE